MTLFPKCLIKLFHLLPALPTLSYICLCFDVFDMYLVSLCSVALSVSFTSSVCSLWICCSLTRANFRAGVATFQCSDTVVFVFVFAIPVCLDPCDPVDCGNSVPPCHSEPVWRNDLVSRMQTNQRKSALLSLTHCTCVFTSMFSPL